MVGEIVNRAARLQSAAPRGGILISADTYRHVRGSFAVQPMTGLQLKGIAEPVDGYLVQSERPRGLPPRRRPRRRGRRDQHDRTGDRAAPAAGSLPRRRRGAPVAGGDRRRRRRRGQVPTAVGLRTVARRAPGAGVVVQAEGRPTPGRACRTRCFTTCSPRASTSTTATTRPRSGASGSTESSRRSARARDRRQGPHHRPSGSGSRSATAPVCEGVRHDPKTLSERATAYLAEYFRRLADQAPVVLLLEDLHWADEAMLALIDAADAVLRDCPVLVVATTRPTLLERHPHWGEGLDFHVQAAAAIVVAARDPPAAGGDPPTSRQRARRPQRSRGEGVGRQSLLRRGAGEVAPRGRRDHQGRRIVARARGAPRTGQGARHAAERAAGPARRAVARRAPGAAAGVGDRAGVLGRRRRVAREATGDRPRRRPTCRPARPSTGCAGERSCTSGSSRRSTTPGSSCSSTRCCATSPTRACSGATGRPTTGWPPGGSSRWPSAPGRPDEYAGLIADHHANAGEREAAAALVPGRRTAGGLGQRARRRPASARAGPRPGPRVGHAAALRPAAGPRDGARPDRRPPGAAGRSRATLDALEPAASIDPVRRIRLLLTQCRWTFHHSEYDRAVGGGPAKPSNSPRRPASTNSRPRPACGWGKGLTWEGRHQAARDALDAGPRRRPGAGPAEADHRNASVPRHRRHQRQRVPPAEALLEEAIAMHREDDDDRGRERRARPAGDGAVQRRAASPRRGRCLEQALPSSSRPGFRYREAVVVSNLAAIVIQHGELGDGRRLITRGLELCIEIEDIEGVATALQHPRRDPSPGR